MVPPSPLLRNLVYVCMAPISPVLRNSTNFYPTILIPPRANTPYAANEYFYTKILHPPLNVPEHFVNFNLKVGQVFDHGLKMGWRHNVNGITDIPHMFPEDDARIVFLQIEQDLSLFLILWGNTENLVIRVVYLCRQGDRQTGRQDEDDLHCYDFSRLSTREGLRRRSETYMEKGVRFITMISLTN